MNLPREPSQCGAGFSQMPLVYPDHEILHKLWGRLGGYHRQPHSAAHSGIHGGSVPAGRLSSPPLQKLLFPVHLTVRFLGGIKCDED